MNDSKIGKKRKAVTRDVDQEAVLVLGDEIEFNVDDDISSGGEPGSEAEFDDEVFSDASGDSDSNASVWSDSDGSQSKGENTEDGLLTKTIANGTKHHHQDSEGVNGLILEASPDDEDIVSSFRIVKGADGNDRHVYDEIDVDGDSEYSVGNEDDNTIGDIPLSYYESFPHIGYNINGKRIMRPARGEALDELLDSIEVPEGWTGLTDPATGKPLQLRRDELELLRKVQGNEIAQDDYEQYAPTVEWFTSKTETMPLSAAPEPKRRFVPSKHEAKRIMKIVRAIREGRILPYKPPQEDAEEDEGVIRYDLWSNEQPRSEHAMHMPAPKLPPPTFDESYHPPPEYLPDEKEQVEWEQAEEEDRSKDYLPKDHDSLRKVPGYIRFVKEKFDRCLDLYLAPRIRRTRLHIDPESLLPKLPSPDELRPFPSQQTAVFSGHEGFVRTLAIDQTGQYLATGGEDGTVRVWSMFPPRQVWLAKFGSDTPINVVRWRPGAGALILAIAAGDDIHLAIPTPPDLSAEMESDSRAVLDGGWSSAKSGSKSSKDIPWIRPSRSLQDQGVLVTIPLGYSAKSLSFHTGGNHIVTVCPSSTVPASRHIAIHTINTHRTQYPFSKRPRGGGTPQTAHFHPNKAQLFVANQRAIRSYDLANPQLLKIIQPGARWISSFDVHPTSSSTAGSDNLLVSSYDRRLLWIDLDLSLKPYKTLRYHEKAIRTARFHRNTARYPLFADGSDDGLIQIFHGQVVSDTMSNARIVPLKVLKGHKVGKGGLGVMDLDWHPHEAWLVSAGGDGVCRLWT